MSVNKTEITVVLADDHELLRDGVRLALQKLKGIKLIGEAANGKQLCALVDELHPDVVITDIKMPLMDGIDATTLLKKKYPQLGIIALSMLDDQSLILDMLAAGANGYLVKNTSKEEFYEAITSVSEGKNYYCQTASQKISNHIHRNNRSSQRTVPSFTGRELDVMRLLAKGYSNKEIGNALSISARTIENYRQSIQKKSGCRNAVEISMYALKHGFVEMS